MKFDIWHIPSSLDLTKKFNPGPTRISPFFAQFWANLLWLHQENFGLEVIPANIWSYHTSLDRKFNFPKNWIWDSKKGLSHTMKIKPVKVIISQSEWWRHQFFRFRGHLYKYGHILYTVGSEILCTFQKRIISYHKNQANKNYSFLKWVIHPGVHKMFFSLKAWVKHDCAFPVDFEKKTDVVRDCSNSPYPGKYE